MIVIKEEQFNNRNVLYKVETDYNGLEEKVTRFDCRVFRFNPDGNERIFIGDRYDVIRYDCWLYLNYKRRGKPMISRMQIATALQYYYTFCDIYDYDPKNFTSAAYDGFKEFLRGTTREAMPGSHITFLCVDTIKQYISMIREYLDKLQFDISAFTRYKESDNDGREGRHIGDPDLRGDNLSKNVVPTHMTTEQINQVAELMAKAHDEVTLCCFQVGITTGIRRGGILGLTAQSLGREPAPDGKSMRYYIVLKNLPSDRDFQHCKTLKHPKSEEHAKSKTFNKSNRKHYIKKNLYDRLMAFYRDSRDPKKMGGVEEVRRLNEATKASGNTTNGENHYLFWIKWRGQYHLFSGQTFNNRLKKYFDAIGFQYNNVSHAMRHSFGAHITHHTKGKKADIKQAQAALDHASIESTKIYMNLTEDELWELEEGFGNELETLVPAFRPNETKTSNNRKRA